MGAGASAASTSELATIPPSVPLKRLPESIEEAIYVHEKFPIIVDTTEQAARYYIPVILLRFSLISVFVLGF